MADLPQRQYVLIVHVKSRAPRARLVRILAYQSDQDRSFFVLPLLIKSNAFRTSTISFVNHHKSQGWSHSSKHARSLRVRAACLGGHSDTPPHSRSTRQPLIQFGTFPNLVVLHGPILPAQAPRLCDPEQINHPHIDVKVPDPRYRAE